jgi:hypothetical protein
MNRAYQTGFIAIATVPQRLQERKLPATNKATHILLNTSLGDLVFLGRGKTGYGTFPS